MEDKNLSILSIVVGIIFLAFVKLDKDNLTPNQKNQRSMMIVMGLLWLFGGIALLSFSLSNK